METILQEVLAAAGEVFARYPLDPELSRLEVAVDELRSMGVKLADLKWRRGYCDEHVTIEQAPAMGGVYQVRQFAGKVWLDYPPRQATEFATVAEAKAAAQADWARQIMCAFSSAANG